jgi:hypothetical protein
VPRGEIDFARLARLNLNGGSIRNVSLSAAFRAAAADRAVTTADVLAAATDEYHKLERIIHGPELRPAKKTNGVGQR